MKAILWKKARRVSPAGFFLFSSLTCLANVLSGQSLAEAPRGFEPVAVTAKAQKIPRDTGLGRHEISIEAAFILRSSDPRFGGLSGLWLTEDSQCLIAVSDRGYLWQAELKHDDQGRLVDIGRWMTSAVTQRSDELELGRGFDAEALAGDGDQGLAIAYEGNHRILRLPLSDLQAKPGRLSLPAGLGGPSNSGIETLATMRDGRFLAIAEGVGAWGGVGLSAWLIDEQRVDELVYLPTPGFVPTGGDRLDDWLYVVERSFSLFGGFQSRIKAVPTDQIYPGNHVEGHLLAAFRWGDLGQNFEGLAAKRAPDGRTLIYLLADDNFSFLQRTVLLQLSLPKSASPIN